MRHLLIAAFAMLTFLPVAPVHAFSVRIYPQAVVPGDVLMLKVNDAKGVTAPEAEYGGNSLVFAECGEGCFFAFAATDLKATQGKQGIGVRIGSRSKMASFRIVRHKFHEIHLSLPKGKVELSAEDEKRADDEAEMLKAIWKKSREKMWDRGFIRPIANQISTEFGVRRIMNGNKESIHRGIDFRGAEGEPVMASNSGEVVHAGDLFFGGNTLVIDHGMGIHTVYMHMSGFAKKPGERVEKGEVIGYVGSTGRSTGPHLHFGLKVGALSANPISLIDMKL